MHFKVKDKSAAELAGRLTALGFQYVRTLSSNRVLLSASETDLSNRLGLCFKREQRTKAVGNRKIPSSETIVTHSAKLPPRIAELVVSLYTPIAPNRLDA